MNDKALSTCLVASAASLSLLLPNSAGPAANPKRGGEIRLEIAEIYFEYNASADDLGVHVFLDGEDWSRLRIENPDERVIFRVRGQGRYNEFGMTELFFEGAEPSLDEVRLEELPEMFPEGTYDFEGITVDGEDIEGEGLLTHAIPDGPLVSADLAAGHDLVIRWDPVTSPPAGFPALPVNVVEYQVIVEPSFQVTVPASVLSLSVSPEFVAALPPGENLFEVLAIEENGNQTLTEGSFFK